MPQEESGELYMPSLQEIRFSHLMKSIVFPSGMVIAGLVCGRYLYGGDIMALLYFTIAFGVFVSHQAKLYYFRPGGVLAYRYYTWRKKCLEAGELVPINPI